VRVSPDLTRGLPWLAVSRATFVPAAEKVRFGAAAATTTAMAAAARWIVKPIESLGA